MNQNTRICSFDITNMYTNIPLNTLTNIIRNTLSKEEILQVIIYEIDRITILVFQQNYFQHNNIFYKQKQGLPWGPLHPPHYQKYFYNLWNTVKS
jgi:hypothetical protein